MRGLRDFLWGGAGMDEVFYFINSYDPLPPLTRCERRVRKRPAAVSPAGAPRTIRKQKLHKKRNRKLSNVSKKKNRK